MTASPHPSTHPLADRSFDLLVVGGGIVGAGVARDAAMRGLSVAVVDRHDFAFGTSGRSTRLLHGGLRYLAQGRVGLVREASVEKTILRRIAPHLSQPLPFVFPTYRGAGWPRWKLWAGVKLYDALCGRTAGGAGGRNLGRSSGLSPADVLARLPSPRADGLTGGVRYFDALTADARLVLDTLRSASARGAVACNYTAFDGADRANDRWRCRLTDVASNAPVHVDASCVVNATGPWSAGLPNSGVRLRLTKGAHVVVDRARLPVNEAVVVARGKRVLFAIPWGDRAFLGTTDTDYDGPLDDVRTDAADVAYVLAAINDAFPRAGLTPADVLGEWAGLRPLVAGPRDAAGSPSDVSRSHQIRVPNPGWVDVAGGKLTTYRLIAQQAVDVVLRQLSRDPIPCTTAVEPLVTPAEADGVSGVVPPPVTRAAVAHYCRNEWAVRLDDVLLRRGGWHYYDRPSAETARRVAGWMGETLGWDDARVAAEVAGYVGRYVERAIVPELSSALRR